MDQVIWLVAGFAAGGAVVWLLMHYRTRGIVQQRTADSETRSKVADGTVIELRQQLTNTEGELKEVRESLSVAEKSQVAAETKLVEAKESLAQQQKLLDDATKRLTDTFESLSSKALRSNNQSFIELAKESLDKVITEARGDMGKHTKEMDGLVKPLQETLARYEKELKEMEKSREGAYRSLETSLSALSDAHKALGQQTTTLAQALRAPQVRGRWGEITLQRVVELAGLSEYCDFETQAQTDAEDNRQRPDLVVRLPGDRTIIVDSKAPLNSYLDAMETDDSEVRAKKLSEHAAAVRTHLRDLGGKAYWNQFPTAPEYVVLFLPGESFFSAALEGDRTLIEDGIKKKVILATPTTLIMALLTVAHSWQQQKVAENARLIGKAGRELHDRLCTFIEHLGDIRSGLNRAVGAYNKSVGSWELRVAPSARKLGDFGSAGVDNELPPLERAQDTLRELPGIDETDETDDADGQ